MVAMPFNQKFDVLYRKAIRPAIEKCGLESVRLDEKYFAGSMVGRLMHEISQASMVIGEITDRNPNVMYELGYADALRKAVLLVVHGLHDSEVPFDIRDRQYISYSDERDLPRKLETRIPVALSQTDGHWEAFRSSYARVASMGGQLTSFLLPVAQRYLEQWRADIESLGGASAQMPSAERLVITRQLVDAHQDFQCVQRFPLGDPRKIYTPNWLKFMEDLGTRRDVKKKWILMTPQDETKRSARVIKHSKEFYRGLGFETAYVDPVTVEKALNRPLPTQNAFERIGPVVKYMKVGLAFHADGTVLPLETVIRIANHSDIQLWSIIGENLVSL